MEKMIVTKFKSVGGLHDNVYLIVSFTRHVRDYRPLNDCSVHQERTYAFLTVIFVSYMDIVKSTSVPAFYSEALQVGGDAGIYR